MQPLRINLLWRAYRFALRLEHFIFLVSYDQSLRDDFGQVNKSLTCTKLIFNKLCVAKS